MKFRILITLMLISLSVLANDAKLDLEKIQKRYEGANSIYLELSMSYTFSNGKIKNTNLGSFYHDNQTHYVNLGHQTTLISGSEVLLVDKSNKVISYYNEDKKVPLNIDSKYGVSDVIDAIEKSGGSLSLMKSGKSNFITVQLKEGVYSKYVIEYNPNTYRFLSIEYMYRNVSNSKITSVKVFYNNEKYNSKQTLEKFKTKYYLVKSKKSVSDRFKGYKLKLN